jgi:hypothetical protein
MWCLSVWYGQLNIYHDVCAEKEKLFVVKTCARPPTNLPKEAK